MKNKSRQQKKIEYDKKYGHIPIDYQERLNWMIDQYQLTPSKMSEILDIRNNYLNNLFIYECNIVQLLEDPEGASRPRFRIINKSNFNKEASVNPFVHVYTPNAKQDYLYMKELSKEELIELDGLINTPCFVNYTAYIKTPNYFDVAETFLCETGIIRPNVKKPDWDNIGKKYCDMYNHNVWLDDSMVIDGRVQKFYSILPRIEIELKFLNTIYTKKQYESIIKRKDYDGSQISFLNKDGYITKGGLTNQ